MRGSHEGGIANPSERGVLEVSLFRNFLSSPNTVYRAMNYIEQSNIMEEPKKYDDE